MSLLLFINYFISYAPVPIPYGAVVVRVGYPYPVQGTVLLPPCLAVRQGREGGRGRVGAEGGEYRIRVGYGRK